MFRTLLSVVVLGTMAATTASAAPVYSPLTGSYYDYVNQDQTTGQYRGWTWLEAKADAESRTYQGRQGHLVTLTSQPEEQILRDNWWADILYGQPHIGGFRAAGADPVTGWEWVTGEPFVYTNWRQGEPNNAGGLEVYLHYQSTDVASTTQYGTWGWNDMLREVRPYFIEYSAPVPEPSALALLALGGAVAARRRRRSPRAE